MFYLPDTLSIYLFSSFRSRDFLYIHHLASSLSEIYIHLHVPLSHTFSLSLSVRGNYLSALVSLQSWLSQSINNLFLPNSPRLGIRQAKALLCHLVLRFTL